MSDEQRKSDPAEEVAGERILYKPNGAENGNDDDADVSPDSLPPDVPDVSDVPTDSAQSSEAGVTMKRPSKRATAAEMRGELSRLGLDSKGKRETLHKCVSWGNSYRELEAKS